MYPMAWTDDPVADADRYFSEQERMAEGRPKCVMCEKPIWPFERAFQFPEQLDGHYVCDGCVDKYLEDHYEVYLDED